MTPPRVAVESGLRGPHARAIAHARRRATVHTLLGTGCTLSYKFCGYSVGPREGTMWPIMLSSLIGAVLSMHFAPAPPSELRTRVIDVLSCATPAAARKHYALGDSEAELQRLSIQHGVFAGVARSLYAAAGFRFGHTLCDLGCGPGTTTFDLAHVAGPDGKVLAIDSSFDSLTTLMGKALSQGFQCQEDSSMPRPLRRLLENPTVAPIEIHELDAAAGPFAAPGSLDGLWCRWLLTWVSQKEEAPSFVSPLTAVLRHCHGALRPGSVAVFWDYFNDGGWAVTSSIPTPCTDKLFACLRAEWQHVGDACVASKLPALLVREGFEVESIRPIAPIVLQSSSEWIWPTSY